MENNNKLSTGVNYIPFTSLDVDHPLFANYNTSGSDGSDGSDGTGGDGYTATTVGNEGRYIFGLGTPGGLEFYNSLTSEYNVAGLQRQDSETGIFVNNTGDHALRIWFYYGDNYNQDTAITAVDESTTPLNSGLIGYWAAHYILAPQQSAIIPWFIDDKVGTQSTRMYFQYRNGHVPAANITAWNGVGGIHDIDWNVEPTAPSGSTAYGYSKLIPHTVSNLDLLEENSFDQLFESINIRCVSHVGDILTDVNPVDGEEKRNYLIEAGQSVKSITTGALPTLFSEGGFTVED